MLELSRKIKNRVVSTLTAVVLAVGMTTMPIRPAEASFDWASAIGAVIGVSSQYAVLNKQLNYLDNGGRGQFFDSMKEKEGVNDDEVANEMLDNVMTRLTTVIGRKNPDLAKKPYNYFVNNNENFNAYCTLGHNVTVNIGLFKTLNYNEDEVAFVVGHELGHGEQNDPANGVKRTFPLSLLAAVVGSQGNLLESVGANVLANMGSAKLVTLPMEKKADVLGFEYATEAGYNPGAGSALWQRVIEKMGTSKETFLGSVFNPSDHPGNESRRDKYTQRMYEYSGKKVNVNKKTGLISVNKKAVGTPAAISSMSTLERSYITAGRIAKVYHDHPDEALTAVSDGASLYFGGVRIMDFTANDQADTWVSNLNRAASGRKEAKAAEKQEEEGKKEKQKKALTKKAKNEQNTVQKSTFRQRVEARRAAQNMGK
jgi:Zn-dependent protease with chaperone function